MYRREFLNSNFPKYRCALSIAIVVSFIFLPYVGGMAAEENFPARRVAASHEPGVGGKDRQPDGKVISLANAIAVAVENNPQLQMTREQVEAAAGQVRQSGLYPNPVLELLAEEMPTHEVGLNRSQNLVAITQPIVTGGKRKLGVAISEKSKEKSEFERDAILLGIMADTKKAFCNVVAGQEGHAIAEKIGEIAKKIYESEKARFEAGEVAFVNVIRAEVELSKARNALSHAEGSLQNAIKELQTVMGVPEERIAGVAGTLVTKPAELSLDELELSMKGNQPALKASKKNVEIAETQLTLEKRQGIPDVNVSAGYKRLTQEDADTVQMGIEIPAPFFNRNQGNIQKGKALSRKARSEDQSVHNELLLQLKKNFNSYHVERKRVVEFRDRILPRAEESLTLMEKGYQEGEFDYLDLLDAQRTWAETRISYIDSLKNLNLLIADIERLAVVKVGGQE